MSNFAHQLKAEMARIARKEMRGENAALKKANSQYRSDVAALKRRLAEAERAIAQLRKGASQSRSAPAAQSEQDQGPALRFRVGGFASLRKKLGLSAAEMGKLIGVSPQSVYHWETGKTRPRASQLKAISAVRKLGKREVAAKLAQS